MNLPPLSSLPAPIGPLTELETARVQQQTKAIDTHSNNVWPIKGIVGERMHNGEKEYQVEYAPAVISDNENHKLS